MENNLDPRIQVDADRDEIQKEIEKAAKDRKNEIEQEIKDEKKSLKDEMSDLKDEAKQGYEDYKDYKNDSEDPVASEKITIAKETSKIVQKNIEADYENTKDQLDLEGESRKESIDRMLDDSDEAMEARRDREMQGNRHPSQTNAIATEPIVQNHTTSTINTNLANENLQSVKQENKVNTTTDDTVYEIIIDDSVEVVIYDDELDRITVTSASDKIV